MSDWLKQDHLINENAESKGILVANCNDDMTDLDRQLWEIDENLMRAELSPAELGENLTRRKELWKARSETGG